MLAARTPDCDGQITLTFAGIARQNRLKQGPQPIDKSGKIRIFFDVVSNRFIEPRQKTKLGIIVRVAQKANVKNQIGLSRHPLAERKAFDKNGHAFGFTDVKLVLQDLAQFG